MWDTDINIDLIVETVIDDFEKCLKRPDNPAFDRSIQELRRHFPDMDEKGLMDIISLVCTAYSRNTGDKCELVITAPTSFRLRARRTEDVVGQLIMQACRSITITGYSISDYFDGMLDRMIQKSTNGVYVNLYVNDVEKHGEQLQRVKSYRGQYLRLYEYNRAETDRMAALHAKMIVVDGVSSLVSSANLSYHGMQGNIEMGILIKSVNKAKTIEGFLKELRHMKVFMPVIA